MSRLLMSQTRPLQLPEQLLNPMQEAVASWSDDPRAPAWVNRLEDRLTTTGTWRLHTATAARPQPQGAAHTAPQTPA